MHLENIHSPAMTEDSLENMTLESLIELLIVTTEYFLLSKVNRDTPEITAFYQRTLKEVQQVIVQKRQSLLGDNHDSITKAK